MGDTIRRARLRVFLAVVLATGASVGVSAPAFAAERDTVFSLVNDTRWGEKLTGLSRNPALDRVASDWADQMAGDGEMSHNPTLADEVPTGWSALGENVATGHANGSAVHEAWMASAGHRANILGDFTDIGIAFITAGGTTWAVEVFARYPGHSGVAAPGAATEQTQNDVAAGPSDPASEGSDAATGAQSEAGGASAQSADPSPDPTPTSDKGSEPKSAPPAAVDAGADSAPADTTAPWWPLALVGGVAAAIAASVAVLMRRKPIEK